MQYNYSLKEVLDTLGPSYRSIDLRAILAALGDNGGWRSVFCVIRFSCKTRDEIEEQHENIRRQNGLESGWLNHSLAPEVNLKPFRGINIELSSYEFTDFPGIVTRFPDGIIIAKDRSFRLWDEAVMSDLGKIEMNWRNDPYACDYSEWKTFYLGLGQRSMSLESPNGEGGLATTIYEKDLNVWASQAGFSTIRDIFERVLGAPYNQGNKFEVRAPIYAHVDGVIPSDVGLTVQGRVHQTLGKLTLECSVQGKSGPLGDVTPATSLGRTMVNQELGSSGFTPFSAEFEFDSQPEMGSVIAVLYKQAGSRMDLSETRAPLRSGNPFFKSYSSFIPETDIQEYLECLAAGQKITDCQLFRNYSPKDGSKKTDELLEYVTTHLLGLAHLNPILLSNPRYDVLNGGMNAGSADILAMTPEKEPLLVSCTMAMPDSKKFGLLLAARTAISQRFGWSEDEVKVMVVTGKPSVPQSDTETPTLAATDLLQLWESIKEGDLIGAWTLLGVYRHFA